ncbi:DUF1489 family protein [Sphingomonas sp. FW199]|uniref:DUF1489 family protein n=1 Tax=Sphingomonas sp. FW199 TaxID=3400217 RepID=UPI003CF7E225
MPLHLTKVAFGAASLDHLIDRLNVRGTGPIGLTTRYLPKRHEEIAGQGSLFWIIKHQLVARNPILGFAEAEGGRVNILIGLPLVRIQPAPKRAHQGWRYLEGADAPPDMGGGNAAGLDAMPTTLVGELAGLGLI